MPKLITTYQIALVFDEEQKMFEDDSIIPNIPRRFALIQQVSGSGEKPKLVMSGDAGEVLRWLTILTMTSRGDTRIEGISRYFTTGEFVKFAESKLQ